MRVVTWNINSVRLRINSVKKVVKKLNPDTVITSLNEKINKNNADILISQHDKSHALLRNSLILATAFGQIIILC